MPKYKIFIEETVILNHEITIECKEEMLEFIPEPDDVANGELDFYAYDMIDKIDGVRVLSVEEDDDYYNGRGMELRDVLQVKS